MFFLFFSLFASQEESIRQITNMNRYFELSRSISFNPKNTFFKPDRSPEKNDEITVFAPLSWWTSSNAEQFPNCLVITNGNEGLEKVFSAIQTRSLGEFKQATGLSRDAIGLIHEDGNTLVLICSYKKLSITPLSRTYFPKIEIYPAWGIAYGDSGFAAANW